MVWTDSDTEYHLWNCPMRFVPQSVWTFARQRQYHEDFPGAAMPGLSDVSFRWLLFYWQYKSEYNAAVEEVRKHG